MTQFDTDSFIQNQIKEIRNTLGDEKAVIACSGGVDSTTCAVLTHRALGDNLVCIFIDTNFMRSGEPKQVVTTLASPPLNLPVKLVSAKGKFMKALRGLVDAESKRKAFRSTFYSVLSDVARREDCQYLVQGTILPDVLETVKGIKTQHNVLEQMQIDTKEEYGFKVVEPLVSLYKYQVREVARSLGITLQTSERQPFPGPGLSVRVIGRITPNKLLTEKVATEIVETWFKSLGSAQYFPAIIDDHKVQYSQATESRNLLAEIVDPTLKISLQTLKSRATGIRAGQRLYGRIILVHVADEKGRCSNLSIDTFKNIQQTIVNVDDGVSRILYQLSDDSRKGRWLIALRAVDTRDFVTAQVSSIPWTVLQETAKEIMVKCPNVSSVYYDITPKPPSSIEFE